MPHRLRSRVTFKSHVGDYGKLENSRPIDQQLPLEGTGRGFDETKSQARNIWGTSNVSISVNCLVGGVPLSNLRSRSPHNPPTVWPAPSQQKRIDRILQMFKKVLNYIIREIDNYLEKANPVYI